jgi:hypothetical protein
VVRDGRWRRTPLRSRDTLEVHSQEVVPMPRTSRRSLVVAVLALVALAVPASRARAESRTYGEPLEGLKPTPLKSVLADPRDGQLVRLEGTIAKVCPNKGCWLELVDDTKSVHVMFEGYSFFVPRDTPSGSKVKLEGKVKVQEPDPKDVEHFKGEGAGDAAAQRVSIVATGVVIETPEKKN